MRTMSLVVAGLLSLWCAVAQAAGQAGARALTAPDEVDPHAQVVGPSSATPLPVGLACAGSYTWRFVAYSWLDTADALAIDLADGELYAFRMPFPFVYYGTAVDELTISDDGWLSFYEGVNGDTDWTHDPIPDPSPPDGVIAPFWTDLDPFEGSTVPDQRYVKVRTFGAAPNRILAVTWENLPRYLEPATSYTFQVLFYERSNYIRFQYQTIAGDNTDMAIGIENDAGDQGVQFSRWKSEALESKALEWRPTFPAIDCSAATAIACGDSLPSETMTGLDQQVLYGCSDVLQRANERIYKLVLDSVTLVDLSVTPNTAGKNLSTFLLDGCNLCNCLEQGAGGVRRVLGPGEHYFVVDGPLPTDSGPFRLDVQCESLLGGTLGQRMIVGDGSCGVTLDLDWFSDGRGVLSRAGWTPPASDRSYLALRVDGLTMYASNEGRSSCTEFDVMGAWVNDNTDDAIVYWRSPEADIIQTVSGKDVGGCCGAEVSTRVVNRDSVNHRYEVRTLYALDFGPAPGTGLCPAAPDVQAGPLHVVPNPADFTVEQDLGCATGLCATQCNMPAELKSADDLATKLVVQMADGTATDFVEAEWVRFFDVNRICDPSTPEPWTGGFLPVPDPNADCAGEAGILHSVTLPDGGDLGPGEEASFTYRLGDGCRLDPACIRCKATAELVFANSKACLGNSFTLDARGSDMFDCPGVPAYEWFRNGVPMGRTDNRLTIMEPTPGTYTYTVAYSCQPPPGGPCQDTRSATIQVFDCACTATANLVAPRTDVCVDRDLILDATGSTIPDCAGTILYSWRRDGVPIAGEFDPLLTVREPAVGSFDYQVWVRCGPPPVGVTCNELSAPLTINVSASTGAPPDLANTLLLTRSGGDVSLVWTAPVGDPDYYEILRGSGKADLPLPGPAVSQTDVAGPSTTDPAAIAAPDPYYYRVRAVACSELGPY